MFFLDENFTNYLFKIYFLEIKKKPLRKLKKNKIAENLKQFNFFQNKFILSAWWQNSHGLRHSHYLYK